MDRRTRTRGGSRVGAGRKPSKKSYDEMYYNNLIISGDDSITAKLKAITHELKSDKKKALIEELKSTTYELKAIAESLKGGGWRKDKDPELKEEKIYYVFDATSPTGYRKVSSKENPSSSKLQSDNEKTGQVKGSKYTRGKKVANRFGNIASQREENRGSGETEYNTANIEGLTESSQIAQRKQGQNPKKESASESEKVDDPNKSKFDILNNKKKP